MKKIYENADKTARLTVVEIEGEYKYVVVLESTTLSRCFVRELKSDYKLKSFISSVKHIYGVTLIK